MKSEITLEKIKSSLEFFNKMYDVVRIVDPVYKRVLAYKENQLSKTNQVCYEYWKSGGICENCISIRAYHDNQSYMKLEQSQDLILIVTALPVESADHPVILELLKNATDTMMIGNGVYNEGQFMRSIVETINDMAMRDPLTQLYNRRFVDDRLPVNIVNAVLSEAPLSVIFIDVDNLRDLNNTYGHSVGDDALKKVASEINKSIRSEKDWVARYGGDEFLVALNNTDYDKAHLIAERIRSNVKNISIQSKDSGSLIPTISLGIHTMKDEHLTASEIIELADKSMYEAKGRGKNRISNNFQCNDD